MNNKKEKGQVIFFNAVKGYGFIAWHKNNIAQEDLFVHWSDIDMNGYKVLYKAQEVEFEVGTNNKEQPKAVLVKVL